MTGTLLVHADYNGLGVSFTEDAWFNATEAADKFGKRVDHWLATQETKDYIDAVCDLSNTRKDGYLKTRRGNCGGTWLHPRLAVAFARWLDPKFGVWCDMQIDALIRGRHPRQDWRRVRHEASSSTKVRSQTLQAVLARQGKTCEVRHFSNESRLINWALTGEFCKLNRDALAIPDLDLLAHLDIFDSVLIASGANYDERKAELQRFARDQRAMTTPALDAPQLKVAA